MTMKLAKFLALALSSSLVKGNTVWASSAQPAEATSAITADSTAIRKVITLIEEMKARVESEASQDEASYNKYKCWCETNEKAKTAAIAEAERRIDELTTFIEEMAATEARLKTEIQSLKQDIEEDQSALATATALRQRELAAFLAEETDLKETLGLLSEAVSVLSKVQLLQRQGSATAHDQWRARSVLLQFKEKVLQRRPKFQNMMQRDLFDMLGALEGFPHDRASNDDGFLPRRSAALVEKKGKLLPWEKTDEQKGRESKSTDLTGAAANAKSYNARSGRILGLLKEMGDETARDLAEAQKNDFRSEVSFQHLRAAKLDEISVATQQQKRKEAELADTLSKAAKAKEDREATTGAMEADQEFLANLLQGCKVEAEQYKQRVAVRSDELVALSETLRILNEDDARDFFGKTISFVQLDRSAVQMLSKGRAAAQDHAAERAMQKIAAVARKHKNWALVSLAVHVQLDAFTKVKEVLDKMLVELTKQQKEEYAKWESCKSNIDTTEDDIKVGAQTKEDLDEKHRSIVNAIDTHTKDIAALKAEEEEMKVSLKDAGEQRKAQNQLFQTEVMDQRATINILNKALARLKQFYVAKLVQVHVQGADRQPGQAVAPAPPKPESYQKSGGAGGVIQLLMKIIENAAVEEQQLHQDEQRSQGLYADLVKATTATIEADRAAIAEKSTQVADLESEKSETQGAQLANNQNLAELGELLKAHHLECDYLLKYFDIRQAARAEEMEAITDAKAVLSGSNFGR